MRAIVHGIRTGTVGLRYHSGRQPLTDRIGNSGLKQHAEPNAVPCVTHVGGSFQHDITSIH